MYLGPLYKKSGRAEAHLVCTPMVGIESMIDTEPDLLGSAFHRGPSVILHFRDPN